MAKLLEPFKYDGEMHDKWVDEKFGKEPLDILSCLLAHLKNLKDEGLRAPNYEPTVDISCFYHLDFDKNELSIHGPGELQTFELWSLPGNYETYMKTRDYPANGGS